MLDPHDTMKALTALAIEKSLLDVGKPVYEKVTNSIYKKYQSYIPDCYEHPEYLKKVLKDLYGNAYNVIVSSIEEQLSEFAYKKKMETFLTVLLK
jgi:hypothetical protein